MNDAKKKERVIKKSKSRSYNKHIHFNLHHNSTFLCKHS